MEKLIVILGPTASGKTHIATQLAYQINGEIISADSRQVYRKMNIGTGKDIVEYTINGTNIPYHLIDICDAGDKYLLPDFQRDFKAAFQEIQSKQHSPILCGGTGLYLEAVLENHAFTQVPEDAIWRDQAKDLSFEALKTIFQSISQTTAFNPDLSTRKRTIRAIEISRVLNKNILAPKDNLSFKPIIFGVDIDRNLRREKISKRLKERLESGMVEEVQQLLQEGVSSEELKYYGLEYKFVTEFIEGSLSKKSLFEKLEIAIHQFSKRQMTWFRRMEKNGHDITWIDAKLPIEEKLYIIKTQL